MYVCHKVCENKFDSWMSLFDRLGYTVDANFSLPRLIKSDELYVGRWLAT